MSDLRAAREAWEEKPGEESRAARMEAACEAARGDLTTTEFRERLAAERRALYGPARIVVELPPHKKVEPESIPHPRYRPQACRVQVRGPVDWEWDWPAGETEYTIARAARAIKRLTPKDAPLGVYRVTVNGTTREVVRAVVENA